MVLTGTMGKFTITDITEGDCIITNPPSECVITSILDIVDNVPNDSGQYLCTAINDAGNNTASVSLTVYGKYIYVYRVMELRIPYDIAIVLTFNEITI